MKATPHNPSAIESVFPSGKFPATPGDAVRTFIGAKSSALHGIGMSVPAGGHDSLGILVVYERTSGRTDRCGSLGRLRGTNRRRQTSSFLRVGSRADAGPRGGSG
jgi:hypothetical protein